MGQNVVSSPFIYFIFFNTHEYIYESEDAATSVHKYFRIEIPALKMVQIKNLYMNPYTMGI